jgi:hypothetical protein
MRMLDRKSTGVFLASLILGLTPVPLAAQSDSLEDVCDDPLVAAANAAEECLATVQAVTSAQPAVGLLIAGGSPTTGGVSAGGLGLGVAPRVIAGVRVNVVTIELPDIFAEQASNQPDFLDSYGLAVPALSGDLSVGLTEGFEVAPGVGGIGAISLIGNATYLPFQLFSDEFDEGNLAWGAGVRVRLLTESFVSPGIAASLMWRQLPTYEFGDVCPQGVLPVSGGSDEIEVGTCPGQGDPGEIAFDLRDLSGRLMVAKQLVGFSANLGLGYDRYDSDLNFGFRGAPVAGTGSAGTFQVRDRSLESDRWTVFGGLSYTIVVATLSLEGGWQQGDAPITGFQDLGGDFDPEGGTWFGSFGARLAF